jgi:hypothetical protein
MFHNSKESHLFSNDNRSWKDWTEHRQTPEMLFVKIEDERQWQSIMHFSLFESDCLSILYNTVTEDSSKWMQMEDQMSEHVIKLSKHGWYLKWKKHNQKARRKVYKFFNIYSYKLVSCSLFFFFLSAWNDSIFYFFYFFILKVFYFRCL